MEELTYNHNPLLTMKEPDSNCVVAIKMKSLYFVALKLFIFVFTISMSTSVNFCMRL